MWLAPKGGLVGMLDSAGDETWVRMDVVACQEFPTLLSAGSEEGDQHRRKGARTSGELQTRTKSTTALMPSDC